MIRPPASPMTTPSAISTRRHYRLPTSRRSSKAMRAKSIRGLAPSSTRSPRQRSDEAFTAHRHPPLEGSDLARSVPPVHYLPQRGEVEMPRGDSREAFRVGGLQRSNFPPPEIARVARSQFRPPRVGGGD